MIYSVEADKVTNSYCQPRTSFNVQQVVYSFSGKDPLMILYHCVTIIAIGSIIWTGKLIFYASGIGIVEGTKLWLNVIILPKRENIESKWNKFGGVELFVGFLVLQVVNLPLIFFYSILDFKTAIESMPMQYALGQIMILFLWLFSTFWFIKIAKVFRKASYINSKKLTN